MPPYQVTKFEPAGVELEVQFSRFSVGGNYAVHGGVLPLLFDSVFGMVIHAAGSADQPDRLPARRLPQGHPDRHGADRAGLGARGRGAQGVRQRRTASTPTAHLLAEANGLMIRLLPGQP